MDSKTKGILGILFILTLAATLIAIFAPGEYKAIAALPALATVIAGIGGLASIADWD